MKNYLGAGNTTGTYYHMIAGFLITFFTAFILIHYFSVYFWSGIIIGGITGVFAGAFKELVWDKLLGLGVCTKEDFYDTCWGVGIGLVTSIIVIGVFF